MLRRFTAASEDYNEPRVYVNNMNTRHATVAIPTRPQKLCGPGSGQQSAHDDADGANSGGRGKQPADAPSVMYNSGNSGGAQTSGTSATATAAVDVIGDGLHPSLEQVYRRVMRRLQRQLNYEELSRTPLAQQFGIHSGDQVDGSYIPAPVGDGFRRTGSNASLSTEYLQRSQSSTFTLSRQIVDNAPPLTSCSHSQMKRQVSQKPLSALGTTPSFIVRYGTTDPKTGESAAGSEDEDERALAQQPCPQTLRLVVRHVQTMLVTKMQLAERGSLRDCLRNAFECRALLDRLLKEIPLYTQFYEDDSQVIGHNNNNSTRYPASNVSVGSGMQLQQLYQEFRKQPVLLPRAAFVQDPDTGAVYTQMDNLPEMTTTRQGASGNGANSSKSNYGGGATLPAIDARGGGAGDSPASQPRRVGRVRGLSTQYATVSTQLVGGGSGGGEDQLPGTDGNPGIRLPTGYGRSARQSGARADADATELARVASVHAVVLASPQSVRGSPDLRASSPAFSQSSGKRDTSTRTAEYEAYSFRERRHTQQVSIGTITDENGSNTVSRATYVEAQEYARQLEVQLAEMRRERDELEDRLLYEGSYTERKNRIVEYLRKTLFRECNMLRSQLTFAAQKEQQMQQQQQHAVRERVVSSVSCTNISSISNGTVAATRVFTNSMRTQSSSKLGVLPRGTMSPKPSQHHPCASSDLMDDMTTGASFYTSTGADAAGPPSSPWPQTAPMVASPTLSNVPTFDTAPSSDTARRQKSVIATTTSVVVNDVASIQSLLDLALMAVEKDETMPMSAAAAREMDPALLRECMQKDAKQQGDAIRAEFEEKHHQMKTNYLLMQARHGHMMMAKDKEIERLQKLMDLQYVEKTITESVHEVRNELWRLRSHVQEQLQAFTVMMGATITSVLNRTKLSDSIVSENAQLHNTLDALRDVVESAGSLFIPMLTKEYTLGYHPWPVKVRNSLDPIAHVVQVRYGAAEVVRLRPSLSILSDVYLSVHRTMTHQYVVPDVSRPSSGPPLRELCARLLLSPLASTEVMHEVRQRHGTEVAVARKLARVNARILWNMYRQRVYTDRSVGAVLEGGLDPHTTTLPVAARVNRLASERAALLRERGVFQKERIDNARDVYRLWKEKQIDIFDGYTPPPSLPSRLTVLSEAETAMARGNENGIAISSRRQTMRGGGARGSLVNASLRQSLSSQCSVVNSMFSGSLNDVVGSEDKQQKRKSTIISEVFGAAT